MLKMATTEGKVDVFNFVKEMRQQRPGMIQTEVNELNIIYVFAIQNFKNYKDRLNVFCRV